MVSLPSPLTSSDMYCLLMLIPSGIARAQPTHARQLFGLVLIHIHIQNFLVRDIPQNGVKIHFDPKWTIFDVMIGLPNNHDVILWRLWQVPQTPQI